MNAPERKVLRYNERTITLRRERDELAAALRGLLAMVEALPESVRTFDTDEMRAARAALAKVQS